MKPRIPCSILKITVVIAASLNGLDFQFGIELPMTNSFCDSSWPMLKDNDLAAFACNGLSHCLGTLHIRGTYLVSPSLLTSRTRLIRLLDLPQRKLLHKQGITFSSAILLACFHNCVHLVHLLIQTRQPQVQAVPARFRCEPTTCPGNPAAVSVRQELEPASCSSITPGTVKLLLACRCVGLVYLLSVTITTYGHRGGSQSQIHPRGQYRCWGCWHARVQSWRQSDHPLRLGGPEPQSAQHCLR